MKNKKTVSLTLCTIMALSGLSGLTVQAKENDDKEYTIATVVGSLTH